MAERIASAALRFAVPERFRVQMWRGKRVYPDHLILSAPPPARHGTLMHPSHELLGPAIFQDQGFITSEGRFVHREEGLRIALAADQIIEKTGGDKWLFSEDMW